MIDQRDTCCSTSSAVKLSALRAVLETTKEEGTFSSENDLNEMFKLSINKTFIEQRKKKRWKRFWVENTSSLLYPFPRRLKIGKSLQTCSIIFFLFKVARYSFSGPIPPKFEHKLRRHKQSFGKIAITVVLDKDENLLWSGLQRHWSCHSNEKTLLPILLAAVYLATENCSSKIIHRSFFLQ